jgi:site-specific recombinase XerC
MLRLFARQLHAAGYKDLHATGLKNRHIRKLFALWKRDGIADSTIRNRLAVLRWLCEKLGRPNIIPQSNAPFGLEPRRSVATVSKAQILPDGVLDEIADQYLRYSVQLQALFGLRREECLKIRVWQADQGSSLALQASWCKGGRYREVPIRTPEQRALLDTIKGWLPSHTTSMIPPHLNYIQQRQRYDQQTREAGLHNLHGLRHAYAQTRLEEEAGHPAPLAGGPHRKDMMSEQRKRDTQARLQVSKELGHSRLQIIGTYCGS